MNYFDWLLEMDQVARAEQEMERAAEISAVNYYDEEMNDQESQCEYEEF